MLKFESILNAPCIAVPYGLWSHYCKHYSKKP